MTLVNSFSTDSQPVSIMVTLAPLGYDRSCQAGGMQSQLWLTADHRLAAYPATGEISADVSMWHAAAARYGLVITEVVAVCRYLAAGTIILRDEHRVPGALQIETPYTCNSDRWCVYADGTRDLLGLDEHITVLRAPEDIAAAELQRHERRSQRRRSQGNQAHVRDVPRYSLIWPWKTPEAERLGYLDVDQRGQHWCIYRDGSRILIDWRTVAVYRTIEFLAQQCLLRNGDGDTLLRPCWGPSALPLAVAPSTMPVLARAVA